VTGDKGLQVYSISDNYNKLSFIKVSALLYRVCQKNYTQAVNKSHSVSGQFENLYLPDKIFIHQIWFMMFQVEVFFYSSYTY